MKKRMIALVMVVAMAAGLCGCNLVKISKAVSKYTFDGSENYTVGGGSADASVNNIEIDWVSGEVEIVYGDVDRIEFQETSDKPLSEGEQMRYYVDGDCLRIRYCSDGFSLVNDAKKTLTVTLPENFEFAGFESEIVSANMNIAEHFSAEKLDVQTVSGELKMEGPGSVDTVDVESVSGNVVLNLKEASVVEMESVSGNLEVLMQKDMTFRAEITSVSGNFSSDFEMRAKDGVYTRGEGGTQIGMESVSGDLAVNRAQ